VRQVVEADGDLDQTLQRLPLGARGRFPHGLEHLVDLEEQALVPERRGDPAGALGPLAGRPGTERVGGAHGSRGVGRDGSGVRGVDGEKVGSAGIDELSRHETRARDGWRRCAGRCEPGERSQSGIVAARRDRELCERVPQRKRKSRGHWLRPLSSTALVCYQAGVVPSVYTAHVTVRHDEVDRFGRVHPGVHLRYLAHAAVEASTAAGYDAGWYVAAGAMWLIRRSTFELVDVVRAGERLAIRTWVEDFRRVRSHRRYTVHGADGRRCLEALTDWVYVDALSGRLRRVPAEFAPAFGVPPGAGSERDAWDGPSPPATPARSAHRVRACDVDTVGHVNNAVYLDLAAEAVLEALAAAGWSLERMIRDGGVPVLAHADVEYLEGARHGDELEITTWFTPAAGALDAHQQIRHAGGDRALVRAATRWRWAEPTRGAHIALPDGVLDALGPLLAA